MTVTPQPRHTSQSPPAALQQVAGLLEGEAVGRIVAASTDLSLVIDADGVIRDATVGADLKAETVAGWLGRRWIDTVTVESRPKVNALLRDARAEGITRWRQVNHPCPDGIDLPIRYASIRPAGDGPILVLGRDMRAVAALQRRLMETQQALERDYDRLRAAETRYRLLFQISGEPVLVVDAGTRRVAEVNPAAARLLGRPARRITGQDAVDLFDASSARALEAQFAALRATGQAGAIRASLPHERGEVTVSASLFRGEGGASALLQLAADPAAAAAGPDREAPTAAVLAAMPEGFVVTDPSRRVLMANAAFLELAQLATEGQARGRTLDHWLGRDEMEAQALFATLVDHGAVRRFATVIRGAYGGLEDVEVAAVSVAGPRPCLGFAIRSGPRRIAEGRSASAIGRGLPRSVEQMTELVGRVSMKTLVRETTDLIEKLCIEAALRITRDNRASAAEMLGLSRQGLYAKMRRYGVGDLDGPADDA
ncbi:transcriptional regulator PpsR [Methylobacterium oryzae]|uniref:Transcriptional regulator PpsR n=1 Tax=Methylobacterium oryzae CBMB20 TaxID=693986 RepID=A0A089NQ11_9HYPH|nr:transcriptional regulator PpsR [Methylobacterium oryzae]AIQ90011.1 transcriptional regulator PpsR [Methylobacterium oryzae CBMB20]